MPFFLAPLAPAAGAALMTAGRWASFRAAPMAWNAGRSLLGMKPTVAGLAAVAAAPTILSTLDNSTGNAPSE